LDDYLSSSTNSTYLSASSANETQLSIYLLLRFSPTVCFLIFILLIAIYLSELSSSAVRVADEFNISFVVSGWEVVTLSFFAVFIVAVFAPLFDHHATVVYWTLLCEHVVVLCMMIWSGRHILRKLPPVPEPSPTSAQVSIHESPLVKTNNRSNPHHHFSYSPPAKAPLLSNTYSSSNFGSVGIQLQPVANSNATGVTRRAGELSIAQEINRRFSPMLFFCSTSLVINCVYSLLLGFRLIPR
jgi:ABC-type antimicrobial peptide transport system permease subunit